jgi:hypothetical protein
VSVRVRWSARTAACSHSGADEAVHLTAVLGALADDVHVVVVDRA